MKKILFTLVVMLTFIPNTNAQNYAMVDNSDVTNKLNTIEKSYASNENISPEVQKLKAEFLREIKQQYFIDRDLAIPRSLEIILMSDVYGTIYTYFTFEGKMSRAHKDSIGRFAVAPGNTSLIKTRHKLPKNIIYQK